MRGTFEGVVGFVGQFVGMMVCAVALGVCQPVADVGPPKASAQVSPAQTAALQDIAAELKRIRIILDKAL